ncbi:MAG: HK97 gp10 family phage protein [Nitrospira sp.]|nr:HK97 gp10 family phage protein [Nitrospira sp.]
MNALNIKIGVTGPFLQKLQAVMQQIRPAMVGGLKTLLLDAAARTTKRASGDVLKVRTGHLRRTIGPPHVQETATGATGELSVRAKYAPFLEYGTRPYRIRPRRAKALRFINRFGKVQFAGAVNHPGLRPRPFFKPSWDEAVQGPPSAKERLSTIIQRTFNEA